MRCVDAYLSLARVYFDAGIGRLAADIAVGFANRAAVRSASLSGPASLLPGVSPFGLATWATPSDCHASESGKTDNSAGENRV
jgi:hypothetical protein